MYYINCGADRMRNNKWNKYAGIGLILVGLLVMRLIGRDQFIGFIPMLIGLVFVGIYAARTFKEVRKTMNNHDE